ncbi:MAG: hypothetical protein Rhob2KO_13640 [Rhodopirellula baltica]
MDSEPLAFECDTQVFDAIDDGPVRLIGMNDSRVDSSDSLHYKWNIIVSR